MSKVLLTLDKYVLSIFCCFGFFLIKAFVCDGDSFRTRICKLFLFARKTNEYRKNKSILAGWRQGLLDISSIFIFRLCWKQNQLHLLCFVY